MCLAPLPPRVGRQEEGPEGSWGRPPPHTHTQTPPSWAPLWHTAGVGMGLPGAVAVGGRHWRLSPGGGLLNGRPMRPVSRLYMDRPLHGGQSPRVPACPDLGRLARCPGLRRPGITEVPGRPGGIPPACGDLCVGGWSAAWGRCGVIPRREQSCALPLNPTLLPTFAVPAPRGWCYSAARLQGACL